MGMGDLPFVRPAVGTPIFARALLTLIDSADRAAGIAKLTRLLAFSIEPMAFVRHLILLRHAQLICPSSNFSKTLSSPSAKNISLRALLEAALLIRLSRPLSRGVSRSSRTLARDAMDATTHKTNALLADGEVVWS
jgi:hypothetical protein